MRTRVCATCNTEKPITAFHKRGSCAGGHSPHCKECINTERKGGVKTKNMRRYADPVHLVDGVPHRVCSKCKTDKPVTEYHTRLRNGKAELDPKCKRCFVKKTRQWLDSLSPARRRKINDRKNEWLKAKRKEAKRAKNVDTKPAAI